MVGSYTTLLAPDGTLTRIPAAPGMTFLIEAPAPGKLVSMIEHQGVLMVAAENGVWALHEGSFHPIRFAAKVDSGHD